MTATNLFDIGPGPWQAYMDIYCNKDILL